MNNLREGGKGKFIKSNFGTMTYNTAPYGKMLGPLSPCRGLPRSLRGPLYVASETPLEAFFFVTVIVPYGANDYQTDMRFNLIKLVG